MTVGFCDDTATTMLTVTCTIPSADQPNPFVTMFYIYENVTGNQSPVSTASAFTRATPDFDTEYLCVSGNYLGNTTATRSFVPGSSTNRPKLPVKCQVHLRSRQGNAVYQPLTPSTVALEPENLTFFSRLGSIGLGKFGDVWKGELRTKQGVAPVALRQITESVPDLVQVVKYLQKLPNHQNIVRCLGFCEEYRAIVHEFVSGGTLLTFLQFNNQSSKSPYGNIKPTRPRFDESKLLKFAWQVAKGMEFLASNKIIHGNLCAHNILMTEDRICKISDYGMTSFISPSGRKPARWSSPEGMQNTNWTLEGDVWSYGILLWEIVTLGARPFPKMTMDMVRQQVTKGYKMPRPSHCGQELYSIMTSCWEMEPAKRCSYDVIQRKLEPIMEVYHLLVSSRNPEEPLKLLKTFRWPRKVIMVTHCQTLNGPASVAVEAGTNTQLICTVTGGTSSVFTWSDESVNPAVTMFSGGNKLTPSPKYADFSVSENTASSTLTIIDTQIEEEGSYVCQSNEVGNPAPAAELTVEGEFADR
ncbi:tyrosine-protein kinase Fes/Fps-like [Diadema antillarum]|uniref:tyrosine-protein kinase Fes/Fps-like n=1 Tax=Diadema antillarum TaxID=105358 RepID=UPI003A8AA462